MNTRVIDEETANIIRTISGLYDACSPGVPVRVISRLLARITADEPEEELLKDAEWLFLACKLAEKFGTEKALEIAHAALRRRANLRLVGREL